MQEQDKRPLKIYKSKTGDSGKSVRARLETWKICKIKTGDHEKYVRSRQETGIDIIICG